MKKFIGNKDFYKLVAALALPLLLQNAVSTFVNLLDNLMVGRIGTESMSGVSIVNQLLFVYNLCLFGGTGGAGIFGAQFFGRGDYNGVRHTLRFNILLCAGFTVIATVLLALIPDTLIGAFLHEAGTGGDLALTLSEGKDYLRIMLFGLPAFCLTTAYVSILRVTGDNRLPMKASIAAIFVNLVFNYLLIYGKLGFPMLGVRGAAIATVLSRYVEFGLILLGTHGKKTPPRFIRGLYRGFAIPGHLAGQIVRKGMPLLVNEMFWSLGMTMLTQCYSYRGLDAIAALNINSTVLNLFNTVIFTMGNTVGIIIGNLLGAEEYDRAELLPEACRAQLRGQRGGRRCDVPRRAVCPAALQHLPRDHDARRVAHAHLRSHAAGPRRGKRRVLDHPRRRPDVHHHAFGQRVHLGRVGADRVGAHP